MPPGLRARRRARHKPRSLPRELVNDRRRHRVSLRRVRRTVVRALALTVVALAVVGPTTELNQHGRAAAAGVTRVQTASTVQPQLIHPVQPWAVRGPAVAGSHRGRHTQHAKPAWVRPNGGGLTSGFGYRWGKLHEGIDLGGSYGSAIYAAAAGTVTFAGPENGYGELITISHGVVHGQSVVTAYGHMSALLVHPGEHVRAGEVIARVGSEGDATGPHLHFEVRLAGVPVNPLPWLRTHGVSI